MKIIEQHFLAEPSNQAALPLNEANTPCISTLIDLQGAAHLQSTDIEGFTDRLLQALPSLQVHRYPPQSPGGFVERVSGSDGFVERLREGLALPHVIEGIALELQYLSGQGTDFSYTRETADRNKFHIVCAYHQEDVAEQAMRIAVETVQKLMHGEAVNLAPAIDELKRADLH